MQWRGAGWGGLVSLLVVVVVVDVLLLLLEAP